MTIFLVFQFSLVHSVYCTLCPDTSDTTFDFPIFRQIFGVIKRFLAHFKRHQFHIWWPNFILFRKEIQKLCPFKGRGCLKHIHHCVNIRWSLYHYDNYWQNILRSNYVTHSSFCVCRVEAIAYSVILNTAWRQVNDWFVIFSLSFIQRANVILQCEYAF